MQSPLTHAHAGQSSRFCAAGTFCGVFRRQALDRGAALIGATKIVTGHNADDIAETVLMNLLRGDVSRLARCVEIVTGACVYVPC
jgi:cytoplasmic tRNA 2-thiolation protein 1